MRRNAIGRWELSDRFWAESDPPEPRAAVAADGFFQKCVRQLNRLTADKRVKYRLTGTGGDHRRGRPTSEDEQHRRRNDRVTSSPRHRGRAAAAAAPEAASRRTAETFGNVPYREVSVRATFREVRAGTVVRFSAAKPCR